jgi:diaminopimelate epimerase
MINMHLNFSKMHGLGNDFVIIDQRDKNNTTLSARQIRHIADRNFGIGCDQLILVQTTEKADAEILIFNADGSTADACGNATRCVAKLIGLPMAKILVAGRILNTKLHDNGEVAVNMGKADVKKKQDLPGICVEIGNKHLVILGRDTTYDNDQGREIIRKFSGNYNINFAQILSQKEIILEVWERGAGRTLACGSGACATFAAAREEGLIDDGVEIKLPGGRLHISENDENEIIMTGAATLVFTGEIRL